MHGKSESNSFLFVLVFRFTRKTATTIRIESETICRGIENFNQLEHSTIFTALNSKICTINFQTAFRTSRHLFCIDPVVWIDVVVRGMFFYGFWFSQSNYHNTESFVSWMLRRSSSLSLLFLLRIFFQFVFVFSVEFLVQLDSLFEHIRFHNKKSPHLFNTPKFRCTIGALLSQQP